MAQNYSKARPFCILNAAQHEIRQLSAWRIGVVTAAHRPDSAPSPRGRKFGVLSPVSVGCAPGIPLVGLQKNFLDGLHGLDAQTSQAAPPRSSYD